MLTIGFIFFLIAVPLFSNVITPSLSNRITSLILVYAALLSFNDINIQYIGFGIEIYSGLFQITANFNSNSNSNSSPTSSSDTSIESEVSETKKFNYQLIKDQGYRYTYEIRGLFDENPDVSIATPENINKYLETDVVTDEMVKHCHNIYENAKTYPLPWSTKDSQEFINDNGPLSWVRKAKPYHGVYHISVGDEDYVGQSIHTGCRVKNHITFSRGKEEFTRYSVTKVGTVKTCIITPQDTMGLSIEIFKNVLEQYLFLVKRPTLNRILVVQRGGDTTNPTTTKGLHAFSVAAYAYHNGTLIYITDTLAELSEVLNKNSAYMANFKNKGSHNIGDVTLTRTELKDAPINIITRDDFAKFMAIRMKKVFSKYNPCKVVLINAKTGERLGPFASRNAAAKFLSNGDIVSNKYIDNKRKIPYRGYYFEFID